MTINLYHYELLLLLFEYVIIYDKCMTFLDCSKVFLHTIAKYLQNNIDYALISSVYETLSQTKNNLQYKFHFLYPYIAFIYMRPFKF